MGSNQSCLAKTPQKGQEKIARLNSGCKYLSMRLIYSPFLPKSTWLYNRGMAYEFKGKIWKDPKANWYFVSLSQKLSDEIKENADAKKNKYGLLKVRVTAGNTAWDSTLFPTKNGNYVFAVKSAARKKEKIEDGTTLDFRIEL